MTEADDDNILGIPFNNSEYLGLDKNVLFSSLGICLFRQLIRVIDMKGIGSEKVKNIFKWKRKLTFEKNRPDGSFEVTIEVPARHENMTDKYPVEESIGHTDSVEAKTTEKTLLEMNDEMKLRLGCTGDKLVNERTVYEKGLKEEKLCDIPITHIPGKVEENSDKWLSTQSYEPKHMSFGYQVDDVLREQILEFEKEYKDVNELVKKDHIKKSISITLENYKC